MTRINWRVKINKIFQAESPWIYFFVNVSVAVKILLKICKEIIRISHSLHAQLKVAYVYFFFAMTCNVKHSALKLL